MRERSRARRGDGSGAGRLVITNLGSQALNFLAGLLLARQLGAAGRGQVALVAVYDEVSTGVFSLGLPLAAAYESKTTPGRDAALLGAALRASLVTLPLTTLAAALIALLVFPDQPTLQMAVFTAVSATPLANTFLVTARMLLVANGRLDAVAWILPTQMVVRLGALGVLAVTDAFTAGRAALVIVLSGWVGNLVGWKLLGLRPARGASAVPLIRYGLKTVPGGLANLANSRLDQMIVAPLLGVRELGIYTVAIGVTFVPLNIGNSLSMRVFSLGGSFSDPRMTSFVRKAFGVVALSGVVTALGALVLLEPLYGEQFADALTPTLVLVPGSVVAGCYFVMTNVANAAGHPGVGSTSQLAGLAFTVVGLLAALPDSGVTGAALVSTLSFAVRLLVLWWLIGRVRRGQPTGPRPASDGV